jgi:colanic acid biosynthesis glycosyl transferase WcaI
MILGINYPPEKIGIAVYTGDMARAFAQAGHEVQVVTTDPYYPEWRFPTGYRRRPWRRETDAGVGIIRCPIYVPADPNGSRRLLHHASFALSTLVPMLWHALFKRPDVVICVAPSLIAAPVGWLAARIGGAVAWLHVQDFEVEAAVAVGLMDGDTRAIRFAKRIERTIMRGFDRVSSIGPEMCRRLISLGVAQDKVHQVRNWADLDAIVPQNGESSYRAEWQIVTPHVALYSGNLANKQGIEIVVAAARRLRRRNDLTFVICIGGPSRSAFERSIAALDNVIVRDLQPKDRLSDLLGLASVHLLPQKAEAADLVLPSKLTNMLASGRPVVATAAAGTGLAREMEGCGIVTPPGDEVAFADAIETVLDQPLLADRYSRTARDRAERDWNKDRILASLYTDLEAAVTAKSHRRHGALR